MRQTQFGSNKGAALGPWSPNCLDESVPGDKFWLFFVYCKINVFCTCDLNIKGRLFSKLEILNAENWIWHEKNNEKIPNIDYKSI